MPDTGRSGHEERPAPPRWDEALAALPLESAQPQAWERLRARLPAADAPVRTRGRWPLWLAAAASLALAVAIPLRMHLRDAAAPHAIGSPPPIASARQPEPPPVSTIVPTEDGAAPEARIAQGDARPAIAHAIAPATNAPPRATAMTASPERDLEPLYAESARLEELLALTRDDTIANGGIAALAEDFDAELALIDVALTQPGLDAPRRAELWHQRVDALRQLAGIETTRRLLSARGDTWNAALVSVD